MLKSNPKHILVTGGAGFIGSYVVDELIQHGYNVRVLDNLSASINEGKLPQWFNKKAKFVKGDVREKKDWAKALEGIDAVIHLPAYMDSRSDFSTYVRTNIESIALLFEVIVENKTIKENKKMGRFKGVCIKLNLRSKTHLIIQKSAAVR